MQTRAGALCASLGPNSIRGGGDGPVDVMFHEEVYLELPAAEISAATHCGGNSRRIPENQPQTKKNAATKTKTPQHRLLSGSIRRIPADFRRIPADFRRIPADFRRKSGGRKN